MGFLKQESFLGVLAVKLGRAERMGYEYANSLNPNISSFIFFFFLLFSLILFLLVRTYLLHTCSISLDTICLYVHLNL